MSELANFSERQQALVRATVQAWHGEPHRPVVLDTDVAEEHSHWPDSVAPLTRTEARPLIHAGWLTSDDSVAPSWSLSPSTAALDAFAEPDTENLLEALRDPDRRLGLILEAVIGAYEADPSQPPHVRSLSHADVIIEDHWSLPPEAAQRHDFEMLEHAGLVRILPRDSDFAVVPTSLGREVVHNPAALLEERIEDADDEQAKSRLRRVRDSIFDTTGKVAVGTTSGLIVKILAG